ncbi:3',5'-cyclic-nucleotide phosphodiesterase [Madurella fahalii]|uniref:Phosphodiesterase n=1 Tax=Madurella fahalii TaxID=1157608 RepID=A0ABQ0GRE4_9PEZI
MENVECNVIYVDRSVSRDRHVRAAGQTSDGDAVEGESAHVAENVKLLLNVFGEVHLCSTGGACLTQWLDLQESSMATLKPTLFLLDTPYEDLISEPSRSSSPSPLPLPAAHDDENHEEELYGLTLLQKIISESYVRNASKLAVTIPMIAFPNGSRSEDVQASGAVSEETPLASPRVNSSKDHRAANKMMVKKCLDLGATDVMSSPMNAKCITNLEVHVYRAHRDATREQKALLEIRRGRKRSWVGISEEKPFSYLREAMVSKLMNWICLIENEDEDGLGSIKLSVPVERQAEVSLAVGRWHFCAHHFTDDELVVAAAVMFKHALSMPELEPWRIPTDQLHSFLLACRAAYNAFVPYHNFRHVVDVLQATFHFLVRIGSLPPYPSTNRLPSETPPKSPIAQLLQPFEALTLLITAIGHDVGHPGVNNGFLVTLNAPLAQLYNDRSVLESFHCAAYSQILRRYWPSAFSDSKMRNLMISSILATDMGLHFDYMKKLGDLQGRLRANNNSAEGWSESVRNEQKALTCALLIKCADISNVSRQHDTAFRWMHVLADEFSRQATMESELAIPTSLMSEPKKDIISLATAQLKFMNVFAIPLFQGVAEILPAMQYCVDELHLNESLFDRCLVDEQERRLLGRPTQRDSDTDLSPKMVAFTTSPKLPSEACPAKATTEAVPRVLEPRFSASTAVVEHTETYYRPSQCPGRPPDGRRAVDGIITSFEAVADFGRSDPYNMDGYHPHLPTNQRSSETTEGSSAPYTTDWASQATSATTGKMPLSPSTQGTSIVSKDSFDRPDSIPVTSVAAPESTTTAESAKSHADFKPDSYPMNEEPLRNGHINGAVKGLAPEDSGCRQLKKKPSRFRINGLQSLFRKHKSSSPPMQATDTAG